MSRGKKYLNSSAILALLVICPILLLNLLANDTISLTKGEYKDHKWYIDEKRVLWWDDDPYIPFTINQIWIDHDVYSKSQFSQHFKHLDNLTNEITKNGETYFILFLTHPLNPRVNNLSDFAIPSIRTKFEEEWRKFAPAITKNGLRAMTFFNEINTIPASDRVSLQEYREILNGYAKSMKEIVGNVPVILKIAGDWNIDPAMAAIQGDYIDGLGGDFFASEPDWRLKRHMIKPINLLNQSEKTKLFWITEFSRMAGKEPDVYWPAFKSKEHMRAFLEFFVSNGATGFFYFRENETAWRLPGGFAQVTPETARWFRELKPEITNKILSKKEKMPLQTTKGYKSDSPVNQ